MPEETVTENGNGWWFKVPKDLPRDLPAKGLVAMDLAVLMVLMSYQDAQGKAHPSQQTVAAHLGVSDDTVLRSVRALKRAGVIDVKRRKQQSAIFDLSGAYSRTRTHAGSREEEPAPMPVQEPTTRTDAGSCGPRTRTHAVQEPAPMRVERDPERESLESQSVAVRGTGPAGGDETIPAPFLALPEPLREAALILQAWPLWRLTPHITSKSLLRDAQDHPSLDLAAEALACVNHYTATEGRKQTGSAVVGPTDWRKWLDREEEKRRKNGHGRHAVAARTTEEILSPYAAGLATLTGRKEKHVSRS